MLNAWIVERWVDNLLGWDPEDFSNLTEIMIPFDRIWIPDTTLYNSLVMDDSNSRRLMNAKLTTRGKDKGALVELLYPTIYKLSCLLDLRFFPFDMQQSASSAKINGISPDLHKLEVPNRKACTISPDVSICQPAETHLEFSNNSDDENTSFTEPEYIPPPTVSKFQVKNKLSNSCASFDSVLRNVDVLSPRTQQRNLAELEFDWLAAVVERIFLIIFLIIFALTSVGINLVGLYYWWFALDHSYAV